MKSHRCEHCSRDGQLVVQDVLRLAATGPNPWVFRYWLCRWHRASWNRRRMAEQKKLSIVEFVPDEELLKAGA